MMGDGPILWILGAGASKHLNLPLLVEFPQFIAAVAYHPKNQGEADLAGRKASCATLKLLGDNAADIEQVLGRYSMDTEQGRQARECIGWCFRKRHSAVMLKQDIPFKYAAYAYLLCCMQPGDRIVTVNYDVAIERTIENALRTDPEHLKQPRIPQGCLAHLKGLCIDTRGAGASTASGPLNAVRFVKLHGSVNWELDGDQVVRRDLDDVGIPFLVYPDPAKPELAHPVGKRLLEEAKHACNEVSTVVFVGYSLPPSDRENHPFARVLKEVVTSAAVHIISPAPSEELLDLAKTAKNRIIWVVCCEELFSASRVSLFGRLLGRKPAIAP